MDQEIVFDFENDLGEDPVAQPPKKPVLPVGEIGQQPKNFVKNYKKVRPIPTAHVSLLFSTITCSSAP